MDATAFETWLEAIAKLTDAQRDRALQALSSSDLAASTGGRHDERGVSQPVDAGRNAALAALHPRSDPSDVASLAGHKVAVTGCPHCDQ